jgi:hypothetical protein
MTELFGRLAPGADLDTLKSELRTVHSTMVKDHPESYSKQADFQIDAVRLRDQIISPARTVLLVLLASSCLVFVIACSNVANLILARSVRREGELAVRAALGASRAALRRTLLAESLLLCGAGAILAIIIARPMVAGAGALRRPFFRSRAGRDRRFDVALGWRRPRRDSGRAPRVCPQDCPSSDGANGMGLSNGSVRITSGTNRRLRVFAVIQIAASFILLAGAGALLTTLFALATHSTRFPHEQHSRGECAGRFVHTQTGADRGVLSRRSAPGRFRSWSDERCGRHGGSVARQRFLRSAVHRRRICESKRRRRIRAPASARFLRDSFRRWACHSFQAAISMRRTAVVRRRW